MRLCRAKDTFRALRFVPSMHCPACAGRFLVHQETRCRSEFAFPAQIEENLWEPEKALLGPAGVSLHVL